ncbi:uncharacterized protein LOC141655099 [Silene latifolia]|uniref:uncharacterized protein LOC141655099 n=1 Tax=Silene latifolia TaxID=37657 RepID=UPI003D779C3D
MNLLCYNCQGLGNGPTVVSLRKLLNRENVDVAVLTETKLSGVEMAGLVDRLGNFEDIFGDSIERKAGVAIIWRNGVTVNFLSTSAHHVDVEIEGLFSENKWRLTGFYGWILFETKKEGGAPRAQGEMDEFRDAIGDCGLLDIGYSGNMFTWWNKRPEPHAIFERLDRGVASPEWLDMHPALSLKHLERERSDHVPLKLCRDKGHGRKKKKIFRFEDMWTSSENCESVVREAWEGLGEVLSGDDVLNKINICAKKLISWSKLNLE